MMVLMAWTDIMVAKDHKGHRETSVLLAEMQQTALTGQTAHQVPLDLRDTRGKRDPRATKVHRVLRARQEAMVTTLETANGVRRVPLATEAQRENKDTLAPMAPTDRTASLAHKVKKAKRVTAALTALMDRMHHTAPMLRMAQQDAAVTRAQKEQQVKVAPLALSGTLAPVEQQVPTDETVTRVQQDRKANVDPLVHKALLAPTAAMEALVTVALMVLPVAEVL